MEYGVYGDLLVAIFYLLKGDYIPTLKRFEHPKGLQKTPITRSLKDLPYAACEGCPRWEFLKKGGPRDPKGYRGIIRGLYRAPLRDYMGVILRNTQIKGDPFGVTIVSIQL